MVTLIGKKLAKEGNEIMYLGITQKCKNCKLKTVCSNLQEGRVYKIVKVREKFHEADGVIMSAAVSDYSPAKKENGKIKKTSRERFTLQLVQNPDILKELGQIKGNKIQGSVSAENPFTYNIHEIDPKRFIFMWG